MAEDRNKVTSPARIVGGRDMTIFALTSAIQGSQRLTYLDSYIDLGGEVLRLYFDGSRCVNWDDLVLGYVIFRASCDLEYIVVSHIRGDLYSFLAFYVADVC